MTISIMISVLKINRKYSLLLLIQLKVYFKVLKQQSLLSKYLLILVDKLELEKLIQL